RYSLFAIRYSLFAIRYSLFAIFWLLVFAAMLSRLYVSIDSMNAFWGIREIIIMFLGFQLNSEI
ncbi:hypothetical protein, partial [Acinetobacter sp. ANC 4639]